MAWKCPHCGRSNDTDDVAFMHAETYGGESLMVTPCCGRGVRVLRVVRFSVTPYEGRATEDDWGRSFQR